MTSRLGFWLQCTWAAPLSVVGLALAATILGAGQIVRQFQPGETKDATHSWQTVATDHACGLWITGWTITWALHHHPAGRMCAMAIGQVILADATPSEDPALVAHELTHVAQAMRWGALFPAAYVIGTCVGVTRGHHYWLNPFELEARAAESRALRIITATDL